MESAAVSVDRAVEETTKLLDDIFGDMEPRSFAVRLWDGTLWGPQRSSDARFTIVLKHPGSLRRMFVPPTDLNAGEAYIYDDFDVEGDIEAVAELGERLELFTGGVASFLRHGAQLLKLPSGGPAREGRQGVKLHGRTHSKERDQAAVRYHYDVSSDFYALWLDRDMVYSCAYFESVDEDLDTAQARKLDYICRKLRLEPGERLLDIGCGWGGLAMHAARDYGVDVTGITLSAAQAGFAQRRIADAGLADHCRVEIRDYREVDESRPFDKLVSVGMFEHVGASLLPEYFAKASRLLKPGGVFLNHGISTNIDGSTNIRHKQTANPSFMDVYVFPDGELLPISATLAEMERGGFEVRDVESLREHYALTLRHWVRRLEAHADEAREAADDVTYRVWRLYMSFCAHQFEHDRVSVYQTLAVKPEAGRSGLPLTRAEGYS